MVRAFRSSLVEELGEKCNAVNASGSSLSLQEKLQRLRSQQQRQQQEEQQALEARKQGLQAAEAFSLNGDQSQSSAAHDPAAALPPANPATPAAIESRPFAALQMLLVSLLLDLCLSLLAHRSLALSRSLTSTVPRPLTITSIPPWRAVGL